ncbi:MAG: flavoprotein, partial [Pseudobdellovibrio sp.]
MLKSKKILFILTGSIACYKACNVISKLKQNGYELKIVLSPSSLEFIGKATIEGLTGEE